MCTKLHSYFYGISELWRSGIIGYVDVASVTGGYVKTVPPVPLNIIPPRIVTSLSHGQYTRKQILRFWGPCITSQVAHWGLSADATTLYPIRKTWEAQINGRSTREPSRALPKARVGNSLTKVVRSSCLPLVIAQSRGVGGKKKELQIKIRQTCSIKAASRE